MSRFDVLPHERAQHPIQGQSLLGMPMREESDPIAAAHSRNEAIGREPRPVCAL